MSTVDIRVSRARARLIERYPFFGCLAMRLLARERNDITTLATDGTFLFYCRTFLDKISEVELVFCIAHEVLHCALSHMTRRGSRPWDLWQAATDYVVNLMLKDAGFRIPDWVKYFDEKYRGLTVEQVCRLLQQEAEEQKQEEEELDQPKGGSGAAADCTDDHTAAEPDDNLDKSLDPDEAELDSSGPTQKPGEDECTSESKPDEQSSSGTDGGTAGSTDATGAADDGGPGATSSSSGSPPDGTTPSPSFGDPGGCGEVLDAAPLHDQAKLDDTASEWQVYTRQAANVARRAGEGRLPGFIEQLIDELDTPRTDWREELRQFVDPQSNTKDYSWTNPSRRMMSMGYYLPGLISDGANHVAMLIDTSGSVDAVWLRKFGGEVQSALDEGAIDKITLVFADDGVHRTEEYQKGDVIDFTVQGRGGTQFAPAFQWVNENAPDAAVAIYFTDLDCTSYGPEPTYPVLWAAYDSYCGVKALQERIKRVPFGRVVELQDG